MLIGEAPCTKDLIEITDVDFKNVSIISIAAIFIIILLTFKSISLPIILVCVIEFAIFINMGIPAYTGTVLPFIASIVIGTIQLGATVDYAILMTNKYKKNRFRGMDKKRSNYRCIEQVHSVDHCQCTQFLCSNVWCRIIFQHRYDRFIMYADGTWCDHQYDCRNLYSAEHVHGI